MKKLFNPHGLIVERLYREYSQRILRYISLKIENIHDAENLAQDVWLKLLESEAEIKPETAVAYIYRIASNLVNDFLRRLYLQNETRAELMAAQPVATAVTPQTEMETAQLGSLERTRVAQLPPQRRAIYCMSRFEEKSVPDIATELRLSLRTVENHLRLGRRDVREYIMQAV